MLGYASYQVTVGGPIPKSAHVEIVAHNGTMVDNSSGLEGVVTVLKVQPWWPYTMELENYGYMYTFKVGKIRDYGYMYTFKVSKIRDYGYMFAFKVGKISIGILNARHGYSV